MAKTQRWEWAIGLDVEDLNDNFLQQAYKLNWENLCKFDSCRKNCKRILCLACFDRSWIENDSANNGNYDNFEANNCEQKRTDLKAFVGLKNLGATCYVNCLLQLWFHNPALRKAIYEWDKDTDRLGTQQNKTSHRSFDATSTTPKAIQGPKEEGKASCSTQEQSSKTPTKRPRTDEESPIKKAIKSAADSILDAPNKMQSTPVPEEAKQVVNSTPSPQNKSQKPKNSVQANPIEQLQLIFARLQFTNQKSIDPYNFIESLALNAAEQQDAQEFGNLFVEYLEKSFANQKNSFVSNIIKNQFLGKYTYATICDHCKHSSVSDSNFYELDLSIQNLETLHDCLAKYFRPVPLDGKYNCSHCNKAQSAHRKIILKSLPPSLNLQLLRFVYDKQKCTRQKLNSYIVFPEILDMTPYLSESNKINCLPTVTANKVKLNPFDLSACNNIDYLSSNGTSQSKSIYILSAVLIHRGSSPHSGHYIAHIKDRVTKDWYKFNDESVERIGPQLQVSTDGENITIVEDKTEVVKFSDPSSGKITRIESKSLKSKTAYMLVYQAHDNEALTYPKDNSEQWILPDHLQTAVAEENSRCDELFESLQIAREVDEQVLSARKCQIACIYAKLVCRDPSEKFEFIDKNWLQNWLTNSSTSAKFPPIDNSHLLCIHDKLDFRKVDKVKCVRTEGADLLYKEFGGSGPRLQDAMCRKCVELEVKLINLKERMKEDQKYITSQAKFKLDAGYDFADAYIVGKNSYRDWQALSMVKFEKSYPELITRRRDRGNQNNSSDEDESKITTTNACKNDKSEPPKRTDDGDNNNDHSSNSDSDDEAIEKFVFNSDVLCGHNQLMNDTTAWRIVPKEVWLIFKRYFGGDPERPLIELNANTLMCPECKQQEVEQQEIGDIQKQIASEQKSKLLDLFHNRKRAAWCSMYPDDEYYALDKQFLYKWQKFIRNPSNQEQPTAIKHQGKLVCKHNLSLYNFSNSNPLLAECPFVLINHNELKSLTQFYPMDHIIKFKIHPELAAEKLKTYKANQKTPQCKKSAIPTTAAAAVQSAGGPILSPHWNTLPEWVNSGADLKKFLSSGDIFSERPIAVIPEYPQNCATSQNSAQRVDTQAISTITAQSQQDSQTVDLTDIDWTDCVVSEPDYCSECHEILKQDALKKLLNYESATIYITKFENRTARRNRNREQAYTIRPTQTLLELKKEIFSRCQVLPVDQRLFLNDTLLDDNSRTMSELRIVPNCSLKLEIDRPLGETIDLIEDESTSRKQFSAKKNATQLELQQPSTSLLHINDTNAAAAERQRSNEVEVIVGFLVGRQRLANDRVYARPGRQLMHVFNYGIDKINQIHAQTQGNVGIKFKPIVGETFGNESESIKRTIELILRHKVDVIIGPQETCHIEAHLAAIFNTPIVSHYCSSPHRSAVGGGSALLEQFMVQTKPPHWKIVNRVVRLVRQLLNAHNSYPRQIILLYYQQQQAPTSGQQAKDSAADSQWQQRQKQQRGRRDDVQYKQIGDLLEIKLKQLFSRRPPVTNINVTKEASNENDGHIEDVDNDDGDDDDDYKATIRRNSMTQAVVGANSEREGNGAAQQQHSLTVLNWHTTFHYGYTRNPFRALIRRHLFRRKAALTTSVSQWQSVLSNQWALSQCPPLAAAHQQQQQQQQKQRGMSRANKSDTGALYIVVGHSYEHLGLMLALDELGLLGGGGDEQQRPSVMPAAASGQVVVGLSPQRSIVLGVDIEPHDERDDSVRFLRGLLMDETGGGSGGQEEGSGQRQQGDLDSIASKYNNYIAVVPSKPERMAALLEEMRDFYNKTIWHRNRLRRHSDHPNSKRPIANSSPLPPAPDDGQQVAEAAAAAAAGATVQHNSNRTALGHDSVQLTDRLFQFIRLPVEAFYLYDSLVLIGAYFSECLRQHNNNSMCRDGRRMFAWFSNRAYVSNVNLEQQTKFDSLARAEGSYSLIARKVPPPINAASDAATDSAASEGGEFDLVPIGHFTRTNSGGDRIQLDAQPGSIDPIWLPFWCHTQQLNGDDANKSMVIISNCDKFNQQAAKNETNYAAHEDANSGGGGGGEWWRRSHLAADGPAAAVVVCCLVLLATGGLLLALAKFATVEGNCKLKKLFLATGCTVEPASSGWFSGEDAENFLHIVQSLLLAPDCSTKWATTTFATAARSDDDLFYPATTEASAAARGQSLFDFTEDQEDTGAATTRPTAMAATKTAAAVNEQSCYIEHLHCHMFPFPSCKFAHWLTAMYQLKEMLFQFQSQQTSGRSHPSGGSRVNALSKRLRMRTFGAANKQRPPPSASLSACAPLTDAHRRLWQWRLRRPTDNATTAAAFFESHHGGTGSLRLLLNKYKSTNECLCRLAQLNDCSIVRLFGATLTYNHLTMGAGIGSFSGNKVAQLIVERPERGNLREALRALQQHTVESENQSEWKLGHQEKGEQDLLVVQLESKLRQTLLSDLVSGLEYLHGTPGLAFHGNLRATTCLITFDWHLKLAGFHVGHMRRSLGSYQMIKTTAKVRVGSDYAVNFNGNNSNDHVEEQEEEEELYWAPELLAAATTGNEQQRVGALDARAMQLADFYSFAFVLYELFARQEPWSCLQEGATTAANARQLNRRRRPVSNRLLVERVKVDPTFRPPLSRLDKLSCSLMGGAFTTPTAASSPTAEVNASQPPPPPSLVVPKISSLKERPARSVGCGPNADGDFARVEAAAAAANLFPGDKGRQIQEHLKRLISSCWSSNQQERPQSVRHLRSQLDFLLAPLVNTDDGRKASDRVDCQVSRHYIQLLERAASRSRAKLVRERQKSALLKATMLPDRIATKLSLTAVSERHQLLSMSTTTVQSVSRNLWAPQLFSNSSFCQFRFVMPPALALGEANCNNNYINGGTGQRGEAVAHLEQLAGILGELHELVGSYRGNLHLLDSQVDSMLRYTVYAGEPLTEARNSSTGEGAGRKRTNSNHQILSSSPSAPASPYPGQNRRREPVIYHNHICLLASFALQLIDLTNRWQAKCGVGVHVRCALHCGPVTACLVDPTSRDLLQRNGGGGLQGRDIANNGTGTLRLTRFVLMGASLQVVDLLEQSSQAQRILISSEFRAQLLQIQARFCNDDEFDQHNHLQGAMPTAWHYPDSSGGTIDSAIGGDGRQDYVMIKRGARVLARGLAALASTGGGTAYSNDLEAYWLLNGPRLSASQRLMLLSAGEG